MGWPSFNVVRGFCVFATMKGASRQARKARLIFREKKVRKFRKSPLIFLKKLTLDLKIEAAFSAPLHSCRKTDAAKKAAPSTYIALVSTPLAARKCWINAGYLRAALPRRYRHVGNRYNKESRA